VNQQKRRIIADVEFVTPLTDTVLQVMLKPETYVDYHAGQYLQIMTDHDAYSYSIANAPLGSHRYELHIRHSRDHATNQAFLTAMKQQGQVVLELPHGDCYLQRLDSQKPILFLAAGSGFAPIKAMIEQLFADGDSRRIALYWGVQTQHDLYMDEKIKQWQVHIHQLSYVSHLSKSSEKNLVTVALEQHDDDLLDYQVVMSGPFDLMYSMRDTLLAQGVRREQLFSDAFSFE